MLVDVEAFVLARFGDAQGAGRLDEVHEDEATNNVDIVIIALPTIWALRTVRPPP